MAKTWVLDTETKGTGANMVPLEKVLKEPGSEDRPARRARPARTKAAEASAADRRPARGAKQPGEKTSTPLPEGHVRKRATGEIGRVEAVDARAGTARVRWLKRGATSTVPLSSLSRR
jgi:hypothetical protein